MSDTIISVEGLGKAYRLGVRESRPETLAEAAYRGLTAPLRNLRRLRSLDTFATDTAEGEILWALKDVSFSLRRGEVLGFVGRNGAGKSTLLKVLSRITEPTQGRVELRGRVSSLLEVGTGFHPELTGRENVYMNGTILGMKKAEIDARFDEIVAFSGVEAFLDTPVKRYSSGMKVRLAFAVAAHLEPEILIIDEVLAVGDADFQKKCLGKMQDVASGGRTVLFVSHNMAAVQSLCTRAIALRQGCLVDDGEPEAVIRRYLSASLSSRNDPLAADNPERAGSGRGRFLSARLVDEEGRRTESVVAGAPFAFELEYELQDDFLSLDIGLSIMTTAGTTVTALQSSMHDRAVPGTRGRHRVRCEVPHNALARGSYRVGLWMYGAGERLDSIHSLMEMEVSSSVFFSGGKTPTLANCVMYMDHSWTRSPHEKTGQASAAPARRSAGVKT
jgi:lipopolysaccharide transport system ATP-binding protein